MNPFEFDRFYEKNFGEIAGLDEAGRGPLAGPVVAAAVILKAPIDGVRDSKELTPSERRRLFDIITSNATYGVGLATPEEIDVLNILNATRLAMERALESLSRDPDYVIVDGTNLRLSVPGTCVKYGDKKSMSIASASIVAKVLRDRIMRAYSEIYPYYGFEKNYGYATRYHVKALMDHGPTPFHRLTFSRVIDLLDLDALKDWLERGIISHKRYESVIVKGRKKRLW